jgi:predicted ABC-type transport system involved in lysophospholipase L1 biosynthesis ATPase subunit
MEVYSLPERDRTALRSARIGFVFQSYHLLPEMNVLENVMLPALARPGGRFDRRPLRARALELLAGLGLRERAEHTPLELSGGEQQRVALARALMNAPALVLADEPTGNLDGATGHVILEQLLRLTRASEHALVMVTHNEEAAALCDRVLRLEDGVLK